MKKAYFFLFFLCVPFLTWAQQARVNASEIIAKINRGEAVSYKDAVIVGVLDLTSLQNMRVEREPDNKFSTKEYLSTVTVPLTFINCTFKDDVMAYYNPDLEGIIVLDKNKKNEIYNTNFDKSVRFENCVFEASSAFKYSKFKDEVSFAGSQFRHDALFKYSRFARSADFSGVKFGEEANFKYTLFPGTANFANASFRREANFKYTKFEKNADFNRTHFRGLANFKYTKVGGQMNLQRAEFSGNEDFKYTQVNNRKVSRADLVN